MFSDEHVFVQSVVTEVIKIQVIVESESISTRT